MTSHDFLFCKSCMEIITMKSYSINAYHRGILPFCFGNLIPVIIMVLPSILCFPGFLTVSYRFPWCLRMFLPVFLRFPSIFSPFPCSVSLVSYFRFCDDIKQKYVNASQTAYSVYNRFQQSPVLFLFFYFIYLFISVF